MSPFLLTSHFALWGLFLIHSVVIVLLLRQVGFLHLRVRPAGARVKPAGPEIGEVAPAAGLEDMDKPGRVINISGDMKSDLLLLFVSPRCAACASLLPALRPLIRETGPGLRWAMVGWGGRKTAHRFRSEYRLDYVLFAYAPKLRDKYQIGLTPYAVLIRRDGVVISKGLVNHIEHLESLLEVRDMDPAPPAEPAIVTALSGDDVSGQETVHFGRRGAS